VEIILYKYVVHKVHRIYIVDDDMVPIGVITLTDIMRFLLEGEQLLP
jgi:CBS domain-containing protein